jgi:hypothetical protein
VFFLLECQFLVWHFSRKNNDNNHSEVEILSVGRAFHLSCPNK